MATNVYKDVMVPRLDQASDTIMYLGKAVPNADTSAAVWIIYRITTDAGGGLVTEMADGDAKPDNVWDDRASLSYS